MPLIFLPLLSSLLPLPLGLPSFPCLFKSLVFGVRCSEASQGVLVVKNLPASAGDGREEGSGRLVGSVG